MCDTCGLCGRELGEVNVDLHHLIPKTFKGTETVPMHRICHVKIHSVFTERELLHYYHTFDRMLEREEIQVFVNWVCRKEPGFYIGTKDSNDRKRKRRR